MLVSSKALLIKARKEGYAVPAINTQGAQYDIIRAVVKAAEKKQSPMILAHYESTGLYAGHDWFYETARHLAESVSVPVAIHLDHGADFAICMQALKLGFTSIMFDASDRPLDENIRLSNEVLCVAHAFGVPVELELGALRRLDEQTDAADENSELSVAQVLHFLESCAADALALGIGNAHGYYPAQPRLRLDFLAEVAAKTELPLVLHGCTGMSDAQVKEAIRLGVAKINFGTQIRYQYVEFLKEAIATLDHKGHSWKISEYASDKLSYEIEKIIDLAASAGRA